MAQRMLGRGSYVLLRDCAGRLFVSKRSERKDVYPGKLDVVISGVVCAGESYKQTGRPTTSLPPSRSLAKELTSRQHLGVR